MDKVEATRDRLKGILEIGIKHSRKHSEDLQKLGLEARAQADMAISEGLLQAAELSQRLASKLEEITAKIGK